MTDGALDDGYWHPDDMPPDLGVRFGDEPPRRVIQATPFVWRDPRQIPPREWLYGRHLIRRFISATVAAGAVGKSSLLLVEAVAMATGRPLLGVPVPKRLRVWHYNLEDGIEEIERRVAAILLHYEIDPAELEGRLFLDSGRTSELVIATMTRSGAIVAEPVVAGLIDGVMGKMIDVLQVDPFVSSHRVNENSNDDIDLVVTAWNRIAEGADCAVELAHHVRKGQAGQGEYTVEDGRGAGALLAKARSARVLNPMSRDQAERYGLDTHRGYFRADNGKANLAPPPDQSDWHRLESVPLGNGPDGFLDLGDQVAVATAWEPPDPMAEVTVADLRAAQAAVREGGPWRENVQARDWVGIPIARALKLDPAEKKDLERVKRYLKVWVGTGMFAVVTGKDAKGNDRPFVEVGKKAND